MIHRIAYFLSQYLRSKTRWVVIANRSGAKIYRNDKPNQDLELIHSMPFPSGRLHDRDSISDRPGRVFGFGMLKHSLSGQQNTHDHLAERFALELAEYLEQGRTQHRYEHLVLVAEARFLGKLRNALSENTSKTIMAAIQKELTPVNTRNPKVLTRYLASQLRASQLRKA